MTSQPKMIEVPTSIEMIDSIVAPPFKRLTLTARESEPMRIEGLEIMWRPRGIEGWLSITLRPSLWLESVTVGNRTFPMHDIRADVRAGRQARLGRPAHEIARSFWLMETLVPTMDLSLHFSDDEAADPMITNLDRNLDAPFEYELRCSINGKKIRFE